MSVNQQTNDVLTALQRFKASRGVSYGITRLGVFGSVARGDSRPDSDVDVVYETDTPNLFRASHMRQELQDLLGRHVDVVRLRQHMNPGLKKRIQQDAQYV